jgi:hypothetical protein
MLTSYNIWEVYNLMSFPHRFSASVTSNSHEDSTTFVLGGAMNDTAEGTSNIEVLKGSKWSSYSPKLPEELWAQCSVIVKSSSTVMVIGGWGSPRANTYIHTLGTGHWIEGPNTLTERNGLSCGVLTDDGKDYIIVVGGQDRDLSGPALATTEILDLATMTWTEGSPLPSGRYLTQLISFNNSLLLVGGLFGLDEEKLYHFSSIGGSWEPLQQTMEEGRMFHFAFLIPDKYTNCTK